MQRWKALVSSEKKVVGGRRKEKKHTQILQMYILKTS